MALPSRSELLNFIAKNELLEKTLENFPQISREQLRALLREAALLMHADEEGVEDSPSSVASPASKDDTKSPRILAAAEASTASPSTASSAEPKSDPTALAAARGANSAGNGISERRFLKVFSDGASRGNPGPAGAGAVLTKADGSLVAKCGKFLGHHTNNHAEYMALLLGLETALKLGANEIEAIADSELLVRQLQGAYRVKSEALKPLFEKAKDLLKKFRKVTIRHVPREQNALADEMSNRAIDERM